ncbi:MAG: PQQ-dependent sugar dehydrogenase, partial [Phycisphaerales bacterium]|nr:PQQ-dependent sugar dehydrogenase [Phycisphaerales bacterium]
SNPFVGITGDDEIWAYGLRNAWRCSFDSATGDLWIGDVGQNVWEEIDYQPASSVGGENYGWRCYEGAHNFNTAGCPPIGDTVLPITEFSHSGGNCSVTGGVVYRGCQAPDWRGTYFYADFCSNNIWALRQSGGVVTFQDEISADIAPAVGSITGISSFGQDNDGNIYICDLFGGEIFRMVVDHKVADWNNDGLIDIFDILGFVGDFSAGAPETDVNGDGFIDIFDVLTFLDWFSNTCD